MSDQIEQDVELTNETEEALSEKKHGGKFTLPMILKMQKLSL